ncbi:alpha/beta hydrolase [Hyphomicrobiales bacterium]|nr:alpha/beta hydrolase [Hyphomicrobiales bacterium]
MEESKFLKFQKAPYLELDSYKAPKGINSYFIPMDDGIKLRVCFWKNKLKETNGTILLQQGHNEFIEKYYETIQEFLDKNYSVIAFDWRGQGMSDHELGDVHKAFIKDFKRHDRDLKYILEEIIDNYFPKPLIGIGHSMGGCIMLSAFHDHPKKFSKGILSAPMLGFRNEHFLRTASSLMSIFKKDTDYLLGSKPSMGEETPFSKNDLTTDKVRYQRNINLAREYPDIRLWGITNAFAKAVNKRFKIIRKKGWAEKISTKVLFINSIYDKVVYSKSIDKMKERLLNSKIVHFKSTEHEVFMERDIHRKRLWKEIEKFM